MHSVTVLLLFVILVGCMMEKSHAEHVSCDCHAQNQACLTSCTGFEHCTFCVAHFERCKTRCSGKRDVASFLRTGTETAKQDDKQREFSSMEAKLGNIKRKWKMPFLEKLRKA